MKEDEEYHIPLDPHSSFRESLGGTFKWDPEEIDALMTNHTVDDLEELGGMEGIAKLLNTSLNTGLSDEHWDERIDL